MFIFSSIRLNTYESRRPWWGRGLPKTIRSFDAAVHDIPVDDILSLLEMLPHLELLHLETMTGPGDPVPRAPICLTALRILSIYYDVFDYNASLSPPVSPVSPSLQLPSLTTPATDRIPVHARLSFPLEALRELEYFQVCRPSNYLRHHSDYFHNLRSLEILTDSIGFWGWLSYFPLHQSECIAVKLVGRVVALWREAFEVDFLMPFDAKVMRKLKRFELVWGTTGIYGYYIGESIEQETGDFSLNPLKAWSGGSRGRTFFSSRKEESKSI